ncbi:autotransporter assembly complex protein TamA [Pseudoroseicyclus aestuarii]|uniref:Autotransporter secretion outer membrane protein TamA n=1 Tax=Pseudoroseicyclus aestuarii TaxID=1795041 RepID=A0A318SRZ8_9RHOB|nr:BamA/TamA family outer membrane protein [Pseudoroseicyclus aestuarii]PYE84135.1 autotransporter secretion outer membrane protein TamA [Pseudoroseicyclus aestuarii]
MRPAPILRAVFRSTALPLRTGSLRATRLGALMLSAAVLVLPASAQETRLTLAAGTLDDEAEGDLGQALENASLVLSLADEEAPTTQDYVAAARADYRRLLTALYAEGYYSGTISILVDGREAAQLAPFDAPDSIGSIVLAVDPGPRFTFGQTQITPLAPGTELPESFASGRIARGDEARAAASAAVSAWQDIGFAKAEVSGQQITADHPARQLDVSASIATGPQLTFGALTVEGNEDVREGRIRAIAGLPQGQIYDPDEVADALTRLRRTGAFRSVALVESEEIGPGDTLPFTLQVTEELPRRIGAGAEISSTEGLALSTYFIHRNLLGGAERLRVDAAVSGIEGQLGGDTGGVDYSLGATLTRPATPRRDTDLTFSTEVSREDEEDYLLDQFEVGASFTRYAGDHLTLEGGVAALIAREEREERTRDYTLLTLPLTATYEGRDNALDPDSGLYAQLAITPFYGVTGIDSGARLYADSRYYLSFGERLTFAARGQLGSVLGADIEDAPADYLFYSGGGGTVRGQDYQSLGVTYTADFGEGPVEIRSGGRSFVGAQLEARVGVTDSIGLVGFYDAGYVDAESYPTSDGEYQAGAGLGLRYGTPIGPIRLDIGTPVTGDDKYGKVAVYIGIGQSF